MLVETLVTGSFQENCYLVAKGEGEEAVVIDPGDDAEAIAHRIEELALTPVMILNTHGHLDHIGAVPDLRERYDIPFAILMLFEHFVSLVNKLLSSIFCIH